MESFLQGYVDKFFQGMPMQLLKGSPMFVECPAFKEIIKRVWGRLKTPKGLFVISVIGEQSSFKSTLLNFLTGSHFPTGCGKCTKGVSAYLTYFDDERPVLVLDTEGTQSMETCNDILDKQLMIFSLICSNIIIFNNHGTISTSLGNMLQVSLFALKYLNPRKNAKTSLVFALRDIISKNEDAQKKSFDDLQGSLSTEMAKLRLSLTDIVNLSYKGVFSFDSAINTMKSSPEGHSFLKFSNRFSKEVKDLRRYLQDTLGKLKEDECYRDINEFYEIAKKAHESIIRCGPDIVNFQNIAQMILSDKVREVALKMLQNSKFTKPVSEMITKYSTFLLDTTDIAEAGKIRLMFISSFGNLMNAQIVEKMKFLADQLSLMNIDFNAKLQYEEEQNVKSYANRQTKLSTAMVDIAFDNANERLKFNDLQKKWSEDVEKIDRDNIAMLKSKVEELGREIKKELDEEETAKKAFIGKLEGILLPETIESEFNKALQERQINLPELKVIRKITKMEIIHPEVPKYNNWFIFENTLDKDAEGRIKEMVKTLEKEVMKIQQNVIQNFISLKMISENMKDYIIRANNDCNSLAKMFDKEGECRFFPATSKNEIHRVILPAIMNIIMAKEKESRNMISNERKAKLQDIKSRVEAFLIKKTDEEYGFEFGKFLYQKMHEYAQDEAGSNMRNNLIKFFEATYKNPESVLMLAFDQSFRKKNYLNVLKFIFNIELYLREILEDGIKKAMAGFLSSQQKRAEYSIKRWCESLIKEFEGLPPVVMNYAAVMAKLFCIEGIPNLDLNLPKNIVIHNIRDFVREVKRALELEQQSPGKRKLLEAKIAEAITEKVKESVMDHYIGCLEKCNICDAKCVKYRGHEGGHCAKHQLCAFAGWTYAWFSTPIAGFCQDAVRKCFYDPARGAIPMLDYIKEKFPLWHDDLQDGRLIVGNEEYDLLLGGWVNSRIPFLRRYRIEDFLSEENKKYRNEKELDARPKLPENYGYDLATMPVGKKSAIDVVFLLDCTLSMGSEIQAAIESIKKISDFMQRTSGAKLKVAFVGYRDHVESASSDSAEDEKLLVTCDLTDNLEELNKFIEEKAKAAGGGDFAEAVVDGLAWINGNIKWSPESKKFIFHILDAPPHGDEYNPKHIHGKYDDFRGGCPCGGIISIELKKLSEKQVHYCLIAVDKYKKEEKRLSKTIELFKRDYPGLFPITLTSPSGVINQISSLMAKRAGEGI